MKKMINLKVRPDLREYIKESREGKDNLPGINGHMLHLAGKEFKMPYSEYEKKMKDNSKVLIGRGGGGPGGWAWHRNWIIEADNELYGEEL